jgi:hypothetical protein
MQRSDFTIDTNGYSDDPAYWEWCQAQTVQALIDRGKEESAFLILPCRMTWRMWDSRADVVAIHVTIEGPAEPVCALEIEYREDAWGNSVEEKTEEFREVERAFELVIGPFLRVDKWGFQVVYDELPTQWRNEFLAAANKKDVTNQGIEIPGPARVQRYQNLRFRSYSEVRIAEALDKKGVMYLPNCAARVNSGGERVNREPDFLICANRRWGILEVDGEPFHPPTRTVHDHARDTLFEQHGIRVVKHYDAKRCREEPMVVVIEFLELLSKNG